MSSIQEPSIWQQINLHKGWYKQISALYTPQFPAKVRDFMDTWIHDQRDLYDIHNLSHHKHIEGFVGSFLLYMKAKIDQLNPGFEREWLEEAFESLHISAQNCLKFFQTIRDTIVQERETFTELMTRAAQDATGDNAGSSDSITDANTMLQWFTKLQLYPSKCENLEQDVSTLENQLHVLVQKFAAYNSSQQQRQNGYANTTYPTLESIQAEESLWLQALQILCQQLQDDIISALDQVMKDMLNALQVWRQEQRLVALGKPQNITVVHALEEGYALMDKCLSILEIQGPRLVAMSRYANRPQEEIDNVQAIVRALSEKKIREQMVENCLIITKEGKKTPRQKVNFASADSPVELLVLPAFSNMLTTFVGAVVINSATAKSLLKFPDESSFPNAVGSLDSPPESERNRIIFKSMTISGIPRSIRGDPQPFWIYFKVRVQWTGGFKLLHIVSLPIVVITHTNQDPFVWPIRIWRNAMPFQGLGYFENLDKVPWANLCEAINCCFLKYGRGLSPSQMLYLKQLLFRTQIPEDEMVSAKLFLKNAFASRIVEEDVVDQDGVKTRQLVDRGSSFGQWLCFALRILSHTSKSVDMAKYRVRDLWKEGRIHGFVPKDEIERSLESSPEGTFILRFPEKRADCLGFYSNSLNGCMLLRISDLNQISLHERIWMEPIAKFLYPNIEKELAFPDTRQRDRDITIQYFSPGIMQYIPSAARKRISNYGNAQSTSSSFQYGIGLNMTSGSSLSSKSFRTGSTANNDWDHFHDDGKYFDGWPDFPNELLDTNLPGTRTESAILGTLMDDISLE